MRGPGAAARGTRLVGAGHCPPVRPEAENAIAVEFRAPRERRAETRSYCIAFATYDGEEYDSACAVTAEDESESEADAFAPTGDGAAVAVFAAALCAAVTPVAACVPLHCQPVG